MLQSIHVIPWTNTFFLNGIAFHVEIPVASGWYEYYLYKLFSRFSISFCHYYFNNQRLIKRILQYFPSFGIHSIEYIFVPLLLAKEQMYSFFHLANASKLFSLVPFSSFTFSALTVFRFSSYKAKYRAHMVFSKTFPGGYYVCQQLRVFRSNDLNATRRLNNSAERVWYCAIMTNALVVEHSDTRRKQLFECSVVWHMYLRETLHLKRNRKGTKQKLRVIFDGHRSIDV